MLDKCVLGVGVFVRPASCVVRRTCDEMHLARILGLEQPLAMLKTYAARSLHQ